MSAPTPPWQSDEDPRLSQLKMERKTLNEKRRKLIAEFDRIQNLDEDDFEDEFPDFDLLRCSFGAAVVKHVATARDVATIAGDERKEILKTVANSIARMRQAWEETKYFGTVVPLEEHRIPTNEEIMATTQVGPRRSMKDEVQ